MFRPEAFPGYPSPADRGGIFGRFTLALTKETPLGLRRRQSYFPIFAPTHRFDLEFRNVSLLATAEVWRVDDDHGNVLKAFDAMGRPPGDLTLAQIARLRAAGAMAPPEHLHLDHGHLRLTVPAHGLAVVLIPK